jgi:hypothetical protein
MKRKIFSMIISAILVVILLIFSIKVKMNRDYEFTYKESELFSCDLTKYVHIPLNVISEFKEYLP